MPRVRRSSGRPPGRPLASGRQPVNPFGRVLAHYRQEQHRSVHSFVRNGYSIANTVSSAETQGTAPTIDTLDFLTSEFGLPLGSFDDEYMASCRDGKLLEMLAERRAEQGWDWKRLARCWILATRRSRRQGKIAQAAYQLVEAAELLHVNGELRQAHDLLSAALSRLQLIEPRRDIPEGNVRVAYGNVLYSLYTSGHVLPRVAPTKVSDILAQYEQAYALRAARPITKLRAAFNAGAVYQRDLALESALQWYGRARDVLSSMPGPEDNPPALTATVADRLRLGTFLAYCELEDFQNAANLLEAEGIVQTADSHMHPPLEIAVALAYFYVRQGDLQRAIPILRDALARDGARDEESARWRPHAALELAVARLLDGSLDETTIEIINRAALDLSVDEGQWPDLLLSKVQAYVACALCSMVNTGDVETYLHCLEQAVLASQDWPVQGLLAGRRLVMNGMLRAVLEEGRRLRTLTLLAEDVLYIQILRVPHETLRNLRPRFDPTATSEGGDRSYDSGFPPV